MKERECLGRVETSPGASVPEAVEVVVFCEHAQLEQIGQAGSFPKLATASHPSLQLFTERLDGATAQGSAFIFPVFIVDVVAMPSEVFDFAANRFADGF